MRAQVLNADMRAFSHLGLALTLWNPFVIKRLRALHIVEILSYVRALIPQ